MTITLAIALTAPFVGAACIWLPGPRVRRDAVTTLSLVVSAAALGAAYLRPSAGGWWASDRVGGVAAFAALLVGLCVCRYASRQFDTERRARQIVSASLLTVGAVLLTDLAGTYVALVGSWVVTSVVTVVLLRVSDTRRGPRSSSRAAARTFVLVDGGLLLGALFLVANSGGRLSFAAPAAPLQGGIATVVLVTATLAAVGRAGLTWRRSWVTATVNAPTSTSALLHAGVVNGGAILLWRAHEVAGNVVAIDLALGALCVVVLVVLAPRIHARVDLKGQLATSTVSQMAFMLLAMALGYPLLALTHLIGHGIYKAGRFMSAGGATHQRARLRRRRQRGVATGTASRLAGALGLVIAATVVGVEIGPDGFVVMGVFGPASAAMWWTRTRTPVRAAAVVWAMLALSLAIYGLVIDGVSHAVGTEVASAGWRSPWWSLGAVVVAVSGLAARGRGQRSLTSAVSAPEVADAPQFASQVAA